MSHLNAGLAACTDLDILRKTIAGFSGLKWNEGCRLYGDKKTFRSYYSHERGPGSGKVLEEQIARVGVLEHSITINDCDYEIGVVRKKDGEGYTLVFDSYDSMAADIVGHNCERVMSEYAAETVRDFAGKNGFLIEQSVDNDGNMVMTMTDNN